MMTTHKAHVHGTADTMIPNLNIAPFVSVDHMMKLVLKIGVARFLAELAGAQGEGAGVYQPNVDAGGPAASRLPPTAVIERPHWVRLKE